MRWEDERYVRVYTRDTPEWSALSWEARTVFWGLLRRCDRAGILQVGKAGVRALAGVIPAPLEVVERAVPELLADGCLQARDGAYIIPNFMPAQDAVTSDAQRKRDQRERDRARVMASGVVASPSAADKLAALERSHVTNRDELSLPGVTPGHEPSRSVTQSHSVPSRAVPNQDFPSENPRAAPAADGVRNDTARKKRRPADDPRESSDATYKALVSALFVVFRDQRGADYQPAGRDWTALAELRKHSDGAEIIRRWGVGLQAAFKARCDTFWDLKERWNALTAPAGRAVSGRLEPDLRRGTARAEDFDHLHGPPGEHEF